MVANQRQINGFQQTAEIDRVSSGTEMPMSLAITSFALGPLRVVVVDALWWRAIRQQDWSLRQKATAARPTEGCPTAQRQEHDQQDRRTEILLTQGRAAPLD